MNLMQTLMRRDGLTEGEAREAISEARAAALDAIECGEDPEEVFMDCIGLEPDYIFDIM